MTADHRHRFVERSRQAVELDGLECSSVGDEGLGIGEESPGLRHVVAVAGGRGQEHVGDVQLGAGCRRLLFGLLLLPLGHDAGLIGTLPLTFGTKVEERDAGGRGDERRDHGQRGRRRRPMSPSKSHQRLSRRRRLGEDRLAGEPTTEFRLHLDGGCVAVLRLLLKARGDDRGERTGIDGRAPRPPCRPIDGRRRRGGGVVENPCRLHERHASQVVWQPSRQRFVEHEAQGVDIAPGIHVAVAHAKLLGAHVSQRAHHVSRPRHLRGVTVVGIDRPRHAEVDHLGFAHGIHEDVAGLEIAVDDSLLVAVRHGSAHPAKQGHGLADPEASLARVSRDRLCSLDHLHHKERHRATAAVVGPEREDLGDIGMPQASQHSGLVFETANERRGREPVPQHLDGDTPLGRGLPSFVDSPHSSLGDQSYDGHTTEIDTGRQGNPTAGDPGGRRPKSKMIVGSAQAGAVGRRGAL